MRQTEINKLLKIRLHSQGEDRETVWAEDMGAAILHPAARYVRIANIPVFHFKPTFGDVVEVHPGADGMFEWDRCGVDFGQIGTRILEDGGRWVAVVDYWPSRPRASLRTALEVLDAACAARDVVIEGMFAKRNRGCAYLAVPRSMTHADLIAWLQLQCASVGFDLHRPEADAP